MKIIDATIKLIDQCTPTLRTINSTVKANESAFKGAGEATKAAGKAGKTYAADMKEAEKINQRVAKSVQGVGKSLSSAAKKLTLFSAGLTAAAMEGIKLNAQFQDGLAKVSTLVDTNVVNMTKIRDGLVQVSNDTGVAVTELTETTYQAISASVDTAQAVDFTRAATIAAKAGFTDSTTAVDGLTTVLNAYGMKSEEVKKISDQMLMTQNLGKTTFGELAQSIGSVATSASLAGVSTEQLFASLSELTKNGVKTPEAITEMAGMITAIQKQSKQSQKVAQQLGIDFSEAHMKAVGWSNFLNEIKEKTNGNGEAIVKLFGRAEAANCFKVLTKDAADYNDILQKMQNSTGATAEAYEKMLTPAEKSRIAMNQLKNAGMELGVGLTPILARTTLLMKAVAGWLNRLTPAQKEMLVNIVQFVIIGTLGIGILGKMITGFGGIFGNITKFAAAVTKAGGVLPILAKGLTSVIGTLKMVGSAMKMMFLNPWGIGIMAAIGLAYLLYTHWDIVSKYLSSTFGNLGTKIQEVINKIMMYYGKFFSATGSTATKIGKVISVVRMIFSSEFSVIVAIFKTAIKNIGVILSTLISIIDIMIGGAIDRFGYLIDFIGSVFTGDWQGAWTAVVNIFKSTFGEIESIANAVLGGVKAAINNVIGGINSISVDIPDWVPGVGGQHYQPSIPMLAHGTDNWSGGPAMIHDAGPEIVDLPTGSRVIPHDKSMQQEYERGKSEKGNHSKGFNIIIQNMQVRTEDDIDKVATALAQKLESHAGNQAIGAI